MRELIHQENPGRRSSLWQTDRRPSAGTGRGRIVDAADDANSGILNLSGLDELERRSYGADWGPWRLNATSRVLFAAQPHYYKVDLDRCTTSAEALDWIMQVAGKDWDGQHEAVVSGLVYALSDVLNPQNTLCSLGRVEVQVIP